jgi:hypothetical protein
MIDEVGGYYDKLCMVFFLNLKMRKEIHKKDRGYNELEMRKLE